MTVYETGQTKVRATGRVTLGGVRASPPGGLLEVAEEEHRKCAPKK